MSTALVSTLNEAMKVIFSEPLINNVVTDSELLSIFGTDSNIQTEQTTGGRYIETAHLFQLPGSVGARADNDYLPVPSNPSFSNGRIFLRSIYASLEMSGQVMDRVVKDEGSFLNYMSEALPLVKTRLTNELDRMITGTGNGVLAKTTQTFQGGGSPYTVVVGSALGVSGYTQPWIQFLEGQTLVFSSTATGAYRNPGSTQAATITGIAEATNTLTITADAALASAVGATDFIFNGDASGGSGYGGGSSAREMQGLLAGVDDGNIVGTYLNIVRSGNRQFQSVVIDSSSATLGFGSTMSEELAQYADDEGRQRGDAVINFFVLSRSAARGFWKSLKQDRVFVDPRSFVGTGAQAKPAGSQLAIALADRLVPFRVARKLPPQVAFGLTTSSWKRLSLGSWQWDDKTGSIWNRVTDSTGRKDAFYAVGKMYEELVCLKPRQNVRIDNLAEIY